MYAAIRGRPRTGPADNSSLCNLGPPPSSVRGGSTLGPAQDGPGTSRGRLGVDIGPMLDRSGADLGLVGQVCDRSGVVLATVLGRRGTGLRPILE